MAKVVYSKQRPRELLESVNTTADISKLLKFLCHDCSKTNAGNDEEMVLFAGYFHSFVNPKHTSWDFMIGVNDSVLSNGEILVKRQEYKLDVGMIENMARRILNERKGLAKIAARQKGGIKRG